MKLMAGEDETPATNYKLRKENERLKAALEALNSKGFDFLKAQIEYFFKEHGFMDNSKQIDQLLSDQEQLKKMLRELLTKGFQTTTGGVDSRYGFGEGRFRPPVPNVGFDGEINQGYSYKFTSTLPVFDRTGKPGIGDVTKYDVACL